MTIMFRSFLIFDCRLNRFFMILRRDIELDQYWESFVQNIKMKLNERNTLEDKLLDTQCSYGKVRGKFDDFNKRFLLVVAKNYVEDIYLAELLNEIFAYLITQNHYNNLQIQFIEKVALYQIEQRVQLKEHKLGAGQNTSHRKSLIIDQLFSYRKYKFDSDAQFINFEVPKQNVVLNNQEIMFKGFMMFDANKQFFYMLVKRGFENNTEWQQERYELHQILANKQNTQYNTFFIQGYQGQFLCDFDDQAKTYFVLYSKEVLPHHSQITLIKRIRSIFLTVPNYKKMNKGEIENKMLWKVLEIIDEDEMKYLKEIRTEYYQQVPFKFNRFYKGKTEASIQNIENNEEDVNLTDYNSEKEQQFDDLI